MSKLSNTSKQADDSMTQNLLEHAGAVEFFATERLGLVKQSLSISRHGQFPGIRTNRPAQQRETRATVGYCCPKRTFFLIETWRNSLFKKSNPFVEGIPPHSSKNIQPAAGREWSPQILFVQRMVLRGRCLP